jgi:uncharacterized protein YndB with AHSA1/START domain
MTTSTGTTVTTQVYRVYIKATPQAVWDAITKPEWTQKYGYGEIAEFDLRPGGAYRGITSDAMRKAGADNGFTVPDVGVDGEVIEVDPPHKLVQTWRMLMDDTMAAEGFTRLTWEIQERKGGLSRLTITHELEGAPNLAVMLSGGMEDMGAGGGWSFVLSDLKTMLETGTAMDPADRLNQG